MLTDNDIRRLVDRIVSRYAPVAVGTFGSYAVGFERPASDLDLFVIKPTAETRSARRRAVQRILFGTLYRLDVHVFTPDEFEEKVNEALSFTWTIAQQARLYYWTPEAEGVVPSLRPRVCRGLARRPEAPVDVPVF
jgi:predicted nucleotidyltransferase